MYVLLKHLARATSLNGAKMRHLNVYSHIVESPVGIIDVVVRAFNLVLFRFMLKARQ